MPFTCTFSEKLKVTHISSTSFTQDYGHLPTDKELLPTAQYTVKNKELAPVSAG